MTKRGGLEPSTLITAWPVLQNLNRLGSNNAVDMVAVEQPIQKYGDGGIEYSTLRPYDLNALPKSKFCEISKPVKFLTRFSQELACSRRSDNRARAKNEGVNGGTHFSVKF